MLDGPAGRIAVAFDLLDEPAVRVLLGIAVLALVASLISLVRSWHAEWRSPLWDEHDTSVEPFGDGETASDPDHSGWELARDILMGLGDDDGE